jgi:hypothetical protein
VQTLLTFQVPASDTSARTLPGDALGLGSVRNSPSLNTDPLDQQQPAAEVQTSITVRHEDLRTVETRHLPPHPEVLSRSIPNPEFSH